MGDDRHAVAEASEAIERIYPPGSESSDRDAEDLTSDLLLLDSELAGHLHSLAMLGRFAPHLRSADPERLLSWDTGLEERARRLAASSDPLVAKDGEACVAYLAEVKVLVNVARRVVGLGEVPTISDG